MQLSYSALGMFKSCPRCFWLDRNKKFLRPRGIMSSFPNGVDNILKEKLEAYRGSLPPALAVCPELKDFQLYTGSDLGKMRNWKTNPLSMKDDKGNILVGAFDDLLYNPTTDVYAMLDYKTKGSAPDQEYCEKYYQSQIDIYTRFLEIGNKKVAPFGVLLYFWPIEAEKLIDFEQKAFFLTPNTARAEQLFKDAITCLEGQMPEVGLDCDYCKYGLLYPKEVK
jgi:hypothetical protein